VNLEASSELRDCDTAARLVAFAIVQDDLATSLPEGLLESIETFDDLAHYANVRRSQEHKDEIWIE
jgi:hypothetical protein